MTDQQRWDAMSCSAKWVDTPHLDRLAAEGVRFSNCVTTSPICVPARVTLATGRYPHNTGVWNNLAYTLAPDAPNWMRVILFGFDGLRTERDISRRGWCGQATHARAS